MAATFNAPLASVLLAVELLLFEWRPRSFVPVAARCRVGDHRALAAARRRRDVPGAAASLPPAGRRRAVRRRRAWPAACSRSRPPWSTPRRTRFARLPIHWMWWPAIGGLIIGLGGCRAARARRRLRRDRCSCSPVATALGLIVGILVVKTLIWSLSLGSGTSGGVLAPVFMIGGALGALEAHVCRAWRRDSGRLSASPPWSAA